MILSKAAIQEAMRSGRLTIDPRPEPLTPGGEDDCPYQTSAVDLRLGTEVSWFKEGRAFAMDLRRGGFVGTFRDNSETTEITEDQPFVLQPRRFVLGQTMERIALPLIDDLCLAARVEGRSSYARCGLLVHFTAPTIHAGFSGNITLEMMNWGPYPINLYPGMSICQLVVECVEGTPLCTEGQFQGQATPGGSP